MNADFSRLDGIRAQLDAEAAAEGANGQDAPHAGPPPFENIPDEAYADDPEAAGTGNRESQATELVRFVRSKCDLLHDENAEVYAIDRQTREVRHIERRPFRNWLLAAYYDASHRAARAQSLSEALQTLAGLGRHEGELVKVHIRCAASEQGYVIDLAEPGNSRAIRVQSGTWRIVDDPGVMFVRPESLRPLPEPVSGRAFADLWKLLNIPEESELLILTWLLDSLRPDTPFPLLELIGEQGSAKSVTQLLLRNLIDPSTTELRSAPKNSEDVFVAAGVNWLLAYDNVSHLSADLQDTLCRVTTGATYATRRFYTNAEEATIRAKRPVSINGIGASVTAQDLVDRTISVELPAIEDRRERGAIEEAFTEAHGRILGGLLDIFAAALAQLPHVQIPRDRRPRLIEYAKLGCAVAGAVGHTPEAFHQAYEAARAEAIGRTIDASPVATALIEWLTERPDRNGEHTVKGLFDLLPRPQGSDAWPRSPKGFADALRRAAPALRTLGIDVRFLGKRGSHNRVAVYLRKSPEPSRERRASRDGGLDPTTSTTFTTSPARFSRDDADPEML
jgi:hypothetical protein